MNFIFEGTNLGHVKLQNKYEQIVNIIRKQYGERRTCARLCVDICRKPSNTQGNIYLPDYENNLTTYVAHDIVQSCKQ